MRLKNYVIGAILFLLCTVGCDDTKKANKDTEVSIDTVDTQTDTGSDTGSETEQPIELEIPPQLPVKCATIIYNEKLSGPGDGEAVSISTIDAPFLAWAYDVDAGKIDYQFQLQLAAYDDDEQKYAAYSPFEDSIVATGTSLANNGVSYGLTWLEGRTQWDDDCTLESVDDCDVDVAFAKISLSGVVEATAPLRLSTSGQVIGRPVITAVSSGWVVAWAYNDVGSTTVMSVHVDNTGVVGTPIQLSETAKANDPAQLSIASLNNTVIVMWRANTQNAIHYRVLTDTLQVQGEIRVLIEGLLVSTPRIVAGADKFMVSFGCKTLNDQEIFTQQLGGNGEILNEKIRVTWTTQLVAESDITFVPGVGYAIGWLSQLANGASDCVDTDCTMKAFAALLNDDGSLATQPILVSSGDNDLNPNRELTISHDGTNWMAAWANRKYLRYQLNYTTFSCEPVNAVK